MCSNRTLTLAILATICNAPLFGSLNRAIIDFAAWRKLGVVAWADFSRHADLGPGVLLYPLEAVGGALFTLAAALSYHIDAKSHRSAAVPIHLAALGVVGGLLLTRKAAPQMLNLRTISDTDTAALQSAFDRFTFWSYLRLAAQATAWLANLWTVAATSAALS